MADCRYTLCSSRGAIRRYVACCSLRCRYVHAADIEYRIEYQNITNGINIVDGATPSCHALMLRYFAFISLIYFFSCRFRHTTLILRYSLILFAVSLRHHARTIPTAAVICCFACHLTLRYAMLRFFFHVFFHAAIRCCLCRHVRHAVATMLFTPPADDAAR